MDKELDRKLDKLISLQEDILKELRRERRVNLEPSARSIRESIFNAAVNSDTGMPETKAPRSGKGPYAGVSWEEWDRMNGGP